MFVECFDCDCVSGHTSVSGVYEITSPVTNNSTQVECVMKDGHGYTVILQRHDGSVDFNRTYAEYRDGFGSPFTEMWLGNEYFHRLSYNWYSRLYIELKYNDSSVRYVEYIDVSVYPASAYYCLLHYGMMAGNASDKLFYKTRYPFGANDLDPYGCKCPLLMYGGWWHGCCSNPCGLTMPYNDPTYPFGWDCSETTIKLTSVKMMASKM
ncbi:angiopoietin-2-like [Crassostrea angulata]|uniref:angiopoietin-2-like n=1 Tax=Magallana angulata TaxID=2784310 RepID=UPI0022B1445A|nr:angiopoietin-2-like [Crassostrea angulata]